MNKKAKLVTVSFTTRIIVDGDLKGDDLFHAIIEAAKPQIQARLDNDEVGENIDRIVNDKECPFGTFDGEIADPIEKGEPKIYTVDVCRIGYSHAQFKVVANNEDHAENIAIEIAGGHEFTEKNADYEVQSITPTGK